MSADVGGFVVFLCNISAWGRQFSSLVSAEFDRKDLIGLRMGLVY